jgi:hypothetical protein
MPGVFDLRHPALPFMGVFSPRISIGNCCISRERRLLIVKYTHIGRGFRPGGRGFRPGGRGFCLRFLGIQVKSPGIQVQSLGIRVQSPGIRVQSPGIRVQSPGIQVKSLGIQVKSLNLTHRYFPRPGGGKAYLWVKFQGGTYLGLSGANSIKFV